MTDPNTTSNSNDSEENVMTTGQTNVNCVLTPTQPTTSTQTDPDVRTHGNHQMRNQTTGSRIPMDHPSRFGLGRAEACSLNSMIPNPNGGGQQANRITYPSDEIQSMDIDGMLSISVNVYHPYPRESIAVQDTQPHNMPMPIIFNTIELTRNDRNNRSLADARVHIDPITSTNVMQHNDSLEPVDPAPVGESMMTAAPMEHPHDTEFSVDTFEPRPGHQLDACSQMDARRRRSVENCTTINNDMSLPPSNQGQTLINSGVATVSNEIATAPSIAANMPQSSSPEASDNEPTIQTPVVVVHQVTEQATHSLNSLVPKVSNAVNSSGKSSEKSTA